MPKVRAEAPAAAGAAARAAMQQASTPAARKTTATMQTPPGVRSANTATEQDIAKVRRIYVAYDMYKYIYIQRETVAVACSE